MKSSYLERYGHERDEKSRGLKKKNPSRPGRKKARSEMRRIEADERQRLRKTRSASEQLAVLDTRPGNSKKERLQLLKML